MHRKVCGKSPRARLRKAEGRAPYVRVVDVGENDTDPANPNVDGSRNEMRSYVCGPCHAEDYCSSKMPLTFPWANGLKVEQIEAFWDATKFPDGTHAVHARRCHQDQRPLGP